MLDICLLGTGGMMPLPGRWLTSLMLRYNGSSMLIDCGEGTQIAIKEKGWSFHDIDIICLTHYHADHVSGLPGMLLSMGNADRRKPVTIAGPKGLERVVGAMRVIAPELPFDIKMIEFSENKEEITKNGYYIEAFRVNHNIICYGYTIKIKRAGRFMPDKALENKVPKEVWSRLQKSPEVFHQNMTYTQDMILGPERKGLKVTYCTDTRPVEAIKDSAANADLFICEGMYGEAGKESKAEQYKHMTFQEAAELAKAADVKEMWLTHYSPSLTRPEEYINEARKIFKNSKTARDKKTKILEFDNQSKIPEHLSEGQ